RHREVDAPSGIRGWIGDGEVVARERVHALALIEEVAWAGAVGLTDGRASARRADRIALLVDVDEAVAAGDRAGSLRGGVFHFEQLRVLVLHVPVAKADAVRVESADGAQGPRAGAVIRR